MLFGFFDCELHRHVRRDLANVVLGIDHSGDFAFAFDLRLDVQIVSFVVDELQILADAGDAVAGVAAQLGSNEQFGDEIGV